MTIVNAKYRITEVLKVETDIITSITVSPLGRAVILVIRCMETFKTNISVFIGNITMRDQTKVSKLLINVKILDFISLLFNHLILKTLNNYKY